MNNQTGPEIDWSIYVMPMFVHFTVEDLDAGESFYNALGFVTLATIPDMDGNAQLVHLRRIKHQDILMTAGTPGSAGTPITFAAGGEDLSKLTEKVKQLYGAVVTGPVDTLWFTKDVTIDDPDGNRVIFTEPRMAEQTSALKWAQQNISGDFEAPTSSLDSTQ